MSIQICGIIAIGGVRDEYPLVQARCHYDVIDVYTIASLVQDYYSSGSIDRDVEYVFPLPPSAAVCSFKAVIDDKKTIKGVVKEKGEAKKDFDQAVSMGFTAGLLEQEHADVFRVSLGNIKPKQKISVHISFVSIVPHDGSASTTLRINMPTAIAPLYGTPPTNLPWAGANRQNRFELTVAFQMSKAVTSVSSPSHPIGLTLGSAQRELQGEFQQSKAFVYLGAPSFLDKDIIIVVSAQGLDTPRCSLERWLTSDGAEETTDAYALTLVPKFELPPLPRQEYVFLVDRSGSMDGGRMTAVKASLQVMLKSLPSRNTTFNIISFGSSFTSLWPTPRAYSAETVQEASRHVDTFSADYGGTELRSALEYAFNSRVAHGKTNAEDKVPASVFLLTDGGSWDLNGVMELVAARVEEAKKEDCLLRTFVLGVGNEVATAMCEGIARAGKATAVFVAEGEKSDAKLINLLKAARGGVIEDLAVDWGIEPEPSVVRDDFELVEKPTEKAAQPEPTPAAPINLFDNAPPTQTSELGPKKTIVNLRPPPRVQQAPKTDALPIPLYPGFRCSIFAIVNQSSNPGPHPTSVKITGKVLGRDVALQIPVEPASVGAEVREAVEGGRLIHTLAAKALIQQWEDMSTTPETKAEIERLGKRYSLASSVTSFLAIDEETKNALEALRTAPPPQEEELERSGDFVGGFSAALPDVQMMMAQPMSLKSISAKSSTLDSKISGVTQKLSRLLRSSPGPPPPPAPAAAMSAQAYMLPLSRSSFASSPAPGAVSAPAASFRMASTSMKKKKSAFTPEYNVDEEDLAPPQHSGPLSVETLARAQNFDGSFPSTNEYLLSLGPKGDQVPSLPTELTSLAQGQEAIWATILTLACLQKKFGDEKEAWEILADKAQAFIEGALEDLGLDAAKGQALIATLTAAALNAF